MNDECDGVQPTYLRSLQRPNGEQKELPRTQTSTNPSSNKKVTAAKENPEVIFCVCVMYFVRQSHRNRLDRNDSQGNISFFGLSSFPTSSLICNPLYFSILKPRFPIHFLLCYNKHTVLRLRLRLEHVLRNLSRSRSHSGWHSRSRSSTCLPF